jgi:hypothetical protein
MTKKLTLQPTAIHHIRSLRLIACAFRSILVDVLALEKYNSAMTNRITAAIPSIRLIVGNTDKSIDINTITMRQVKMTAHRPPMESRSIRFGNHLRNKWYRTDENSLNRRK